MCPEHIPKTSFVACQHTFYTSSLVSFFVFFNTGNLSGLLEFIQRQHGAIRPLTFEFSFNIGPFQTYLAFLSAITALVDQMVYNLINYSHRNIIYTDVAFTFKIFYSQLVFTLVHDQCGSQKQYNTEHMRKILYNTLLYVTFKK